MAEVAGRWENERAAWIRGHKWADKKSAARRAAQLAKRARQLDRDRSGRGDSGQTEADLPTLFHRWTHHEDSWTAFLGTVAFVIVFAIVLPFWFGLAWAVGTVTHWAWEQAADKYRVRPWLFVVVAAVVAALFVVIRRLDLDLWVITPLSGVLETATGGLVAPAVLSMWYAAGILSWLEIQVVLGLVYGGWLAHAWGWSAPAVRRDVRARSSKRANGKQDKGVQIINGPSESDTAVPTEEDGPEQHLVHDPDPLKVISAEAGGKAHDR